MMTEELTLVEVDEILEKIADRESEIKAMEAQRDEMIARYQAKIDRAKKICEQATAENRETIAFWTEKLRRYAVANVTDKKRSIKLPSGTLSLRKQSPKFFFDGKEITGSNETLIDFVKKSAPEFLKTKTEEYADWSNFKTQLVIDGDNVTFKATGEVIDGLRAQILPDKFTIKFED